MQINYAVVFIAPTENFDVNFTENTTSYSLRSLS